MDVGDARVAQLAKNWTRESIGLAKALESMRRSVLSDLNNSLKIHEENTKKITAVSVVLYAIKFHVNLHKL